MGGVSAERSPTIDNRQSPNTGNPNPSYHCARPRRRPHAPCPFPSGNVCFFFFSESRCVLFRPRANLIVLHPLDVGRIRHPLYSTSTSTNCRDKSTRRHKHCAARPNPTRNFMRQPAKPLFLRTETNNHLPWTPTPMGFQTP